MQDALLLGIPSMRAVQQTGSGTAAAHSLGVSPATVIRRIESLEAAIGVRLFDRTSSGMLPTLALQRVLPWAEQIAANASALEREVSGLESQAEGVVRVALLPAFSASRAA